MIFQCAQLSVHKSEELDGLLPYDYRLKIKIDLFFATFHNMLCVSSFICEFESNSWIKWILEN